MREDFTKAQWRRIRELAGTAHDRELSRELAGLEDDFARWRRGEVSAHGLNDRIHTFHNGASRRLYSVYTGSYLQVAVASAIARRVITEEEAGKEIVTLLESSIELVRQDIASGETEQTGSDPG
jgi:hypothetical protein